MLAGLIIFFTIVSALAAGIASGWIILSAMLFLFHRHQQPAPAKAEALRAHSAAS